MTARTSMDFEPSQHICGCVRGQRVSLGGDRGEAQLARPAQPSASRAIETEVRILLSSSTSAIVGIYASPKKASASRREVVTSALAMMAIWRVGRPSE